MDNRIGFRRNIYLAWMEAVAALRVASADPVLIRARLDPIVATVVKSDENRGYALTILLNIWVNSQRPYPRLHTAALELYQHSTRAEDRRCLHYGMTLLSYPFFHQAVIAIGQHRRNHETMTSAELKKAMIAQRGHLGGLDNAVQRVIFSLRDWGILANTGQRYHYAPPSTPSSPSSIPVETWLLAAALSTYPDKEIALTDLLRLPELFPFAIHLSIDALRQSPWFIVQRQGIGIDMVRVRVGS